MILLTRKLTTSEVRISTYEKLNRNLKENFILFCKTWSNMVENLMTEEHYFL